MIANGLPVSRLGPTWMSLLFVSSLVLVSCSPKAPPPPPPPVPEVAVLTVKTEPVTVYDEYVAQTEAIDTVEVRARVGGILETQNYTDGATVQKDQILFQIDSQPFKAALAQAKAALMQAQASHTNSRQVLERIRPLVKDHALSAQDLDAAVAKEGVDAANDESAKAQLTTAELNLSYTTIRAPRSGKVSKSLIKPGGLVNASTTLLTTLYSVDPIYVNFTVSEQKLMEIQKRLKGALTPDKKAINYAIKLVDGTTYPHPGRLNFVDTVIDAKTGTLQLRLLGPNAEQSLRAGQFVRVVVPGAVNAAAVRLPQQAVQEMQGKRAVLLVDPQGKVSYQEINATMREGNNWIVEGGLNPGDIVVAEGVNKVRPGAMVKTIPYVASPAPGAPPAAPALTPAKPEKSEADKVKG